MGVPQGGPVTVKPLAVVPSRSEARWRGNLTTQGAGIETIAAPTFEGVDWQAVADRLAEINGWKRPPPE